MKKNSVKVGILLASATMLPLQSCIGSFGLTHKVLDWNNQIGTKFANELVFFAFWVLPVYPVTALADLLVINSIEFWSGNNPTEASTKTVDTEQGKYYIACDGKGYTITAPNGDEMRLDFETETQTWSVGLADGEKYPFMTMIDESHVKMITPSGDFEMIELSQKGLQAYTAIVNQSDMALSESRK